MLLPVFQNMNNFLDLLATDFNLDVVVNGQSQVCGLDAVLTFDSSDRVTIDNIEVLPKYQYLAQDNKLCITEPFYQWHHKVSGQGWLLTPQLNNKSVGC